MAPPPSKPAQSPAHSPAQIPALTPDQQARVQALVAAHRDRPDALIELFHAIQAALGWVPDAVVPAIAESLNRSRAEVHGVLTYYHAFRRQPPGRHVLQVCTAEACLACGADALLAATRQHLGCADGQTRADGAVTLERVYCLGLCAAAPAVRLDDRLHARMTPEALARLTDAALAASAAAHPAAQPVAMVGAPA